MDTAAPAARPPSSLAVQRATSRALAPVWVPLSAAVLRLGLGWRIRDAAAARREYRRLRASPEPLLVCANHLTMVDSFLVGMALGSPLSYLRDFGALPWNVPERANFATARWQRALAWLAKCIPVSRGGDRGEVARTLEQVQWVLARGDAVLIFPEGGRSRSGRVDPGQAAWGVGRLVRALPGCRVLCVYLRGDAQESWSTMPRRGERFRVALRCLEPKTDHRGVRGSMDVARQIVATLAELEEIHLRDRK